MSWKGNSNRRYLGNQWKLYILKKEETPTSCGFFAKKIKNSWKLKNGANAYPGFTIWTNLNVH